ncbi:hypothetical protein Tco_1096309, partial [Tanacetum coccineum]
TYLENLKGELSSVEDENAKLSDEVENLMKGYLEDSIRLQRNGEFLRCTALHWPLVLNRTPYSGSIVYSNNTKEAYDEVLLPEYGEVLLRFAGNYVVFDSKNISFTLVKEIDGLYQACTVVESLVPPTFALGICNRLRVCALRD